MTWLYRTKADREKRDAHIMELWALGLSRDDIANAVGLTPTRISQIVNSFGVGWTHAGPGRKREEVRSKHT